MVEKDTSLKLKALTEKITSIPTLPTVITKITQLMQNPRISADEVGKAISSDQSLASKVLRLVNSAFYGFPGRINTITHAIVILGFNTVKNIVLTASIFETFGKDGKEKDFELDKFWLHSIAVGAIARTLAKQMNFKGHEEAFISGLMHDIGKVVLAQFARELFLKVLDKRKEKNCLIFDAEMEVLGVSHQDVGGWLIEKWNLPGDLHSCVRNHHYPTVSRNYFTITALTHLADIFARTLGLGSGGDNRMPGMDTKAWDMLNPNDKFLEKQFSESEQEVEKAAVFLQII
ncbi:MAG: HDOD domain-containing protein [bacterium]